MKDRDGMREHIIHKAEEIVFADKNDADCFDAEDYARFDLEEIEKYDEFIPEEKIDDFLLEKAYAIVEIRPEQFSCYFDFDALAEELLVDYEEVMFFGEIWWAK